MSKKNRHSHTTLPHTLGELELCVMESVWQAPGISAKEIVEAVSYQQATSLSTIQSTLERLVRKELLIRVKQGYAFQYSALVSRSQLLGKLLKDVIHLLHDGKTETILSSFVNVAAKMDEAALEKLERLIKLKREAMENKDD